MSAKIHTSYVRGSVLREYVLFLSAFFLLGMCGVFKDTSLHQTAALHHILIVERLEKRAQVVLSWQVILETMNRLSILW
jgi:hypothetical protein